MVDIDKILKSTVKKGEVKLGTKETKQAIKNGKAKLIVLSDNCKENVDITKMANKKKIPIYKFKSNAINLGTTCGKAFAVSSFAVLNDGGSNIIKLIDKK